MQELVQRSLLTRTFSNKQLVLLPFELKKENYLTTMLYGCYNLERSIKFRSIFFIWLYQGKKLLFTILLTESKQCVEHLYLIWHYSGLLWLCLT